MAIFELHLRPDDHVYAQSVISASLCRPTCKPWSGSSATASIDDSIYCCFDLSMPRLLASIPYSLRHALLLMDLSPQTLKIIEGSLIAVDRRVAHIDFRFWITGNNHSSITKDEEKIDSPRPSNRFWTSRFNRLDNDRLAARYNLSPSSRQISAHPSIVQVLGF